MNRPAFQAFVASFLGLMAEYESARRQGKSVAEYRKWCDGMDAWARAGRTLD